MLDVNFGTRFFIDISIFLFFYFFGYCILFLLGFFGVGLGVFVCFVCVCFVCVFFCCCCVFCFFYLIYDFWGVYQWGLTIHFFVDIKYLFVLVFLILYLIVCFRFFYFIFFFLHYMRFVLDLPVTDWESTEHCVNSTCYSSRERILTWISVGKIY